MKRAAVITACVVIVAFGVACNRHDEQANAGKKSIVDLAIPPKLPVVPTPVVVTGCLMGAGKEFVLATADKAQDNNIVYELTNAGDQLIVLVGQKVRVTGEAEPIQVAETRELTPVAPATAATSGKTAAKVATIEDTKLQLRRMTVTSVAGTGDSCVTVSR